MKQAKKEHETSEGTNKYLQREISSLKVRNKPVKPRNSVTIESVQNLQASIADKLTAIEKLKDDEEAAAVQWNLKLQAKEDELDKLKTRFEMGVGGVGGMMAAVKSARSEMELRGGLAAAGLVKEGGILAVTREIRQVARLTKVQTSVESTHYAM